MGDACRGYSMAEHLLGTAMCSQSMAIQAVVAVDFLAARQHPRYRSVRHGGRANPSVSCFCLL